MLLINIWRQPQATATNSGLAAWGCLLICVGHYFLFVPNDNGPGSLIFLTVSILAADLCLIYLGSSFALLPACRNIKTGFLYGTIRHPAYLLYILGDIVFVVSNTHPQNFVVAILGIGAFWYRAHLEEDILQKNIHYQTYCKKVPWKFMPHIY